MIIQVVAAIIRDSDGRILITRRPDNVHLAGLWEFPGGKVEGDETLESALFREIQEEIGVTIEVLSEYFRVAHAYPTRTVQLFFFESRILSGTPQPLHVADLRWVRPAELEQFSFPEADLELITRLKR